MMKSKNLVQSFLQDIKDDFHGKKRPGRKEEKKTDQQQDHSKSQDKHRKRDREQSALVEQKRKSEDSSKKNKKQRRQEPKFSKNEGASVSSLAKHATNTTTNSTTALPRGRVDINFSFDYRYILAPMVGASELAFRLLCRKYGAQLAYTPMMSALQFAHDPVYRLAEFQTCAADRPLVCHFWANTPQDFAAAAVAAAPFCDAIDLNLGCPQRTAYVGHFGSYLLDETDRTLICQMIRAAVVAAAPPVPIFCKIRLLETIEQTCRLVCQLAEAGASLVAIHARYRASWERKGPSARDGPALLDQVAVIRQHVRDEGYSTKIVTNGNTISWQDVEDNLKLTSADGLMSAEGILDNPALFLPRYGPDPRASKNHKDLDISIPDWTPLINCGELSTTDNDKHAQRAQRAQKKVQKYTKKLKEIDKLQEQVEELSQEELEKIAQKEELINKLTKAKAKAASKDHSSAVSSSSTTNTFKTVKLSTLYKAAQDKLALSREYLDLATKYPVKMRTVTFHIRRILKDNLVQYQLLDDCLACPSIDEVVKILDKIEGYQNNPASFVFDQEKAKKEKEALERKRAEEGRRRAFEERMMRKAKREGKKDLTYYLRVGADVPSVETVAQLKKILAKDRNEALEAWKARNHAQHCFAFHLQDGGCPRGRTCAFLHVDCASGKCNAFEEKEEVAG